MISFKYRKEKTGILGERTLRPVATVFIKDQDGTWQKFEPYIDSGADVSLISFSTGQLLGLNPKDGTKSTLGGIAGGLPVVYTKVMMRIGEHEFEAKVAWAQVHGVPPLLGRADVFEVFNITFKQAEGIIEFEKN